MSFDPRIEPTIAAAKDITSDEAAGLSRLGKIMRGRRKPTFTEIPQTGDRVALVLLSGSARQECLGAALQRFDDLGIPPELRSYTDMESEITWQVVHHVMRDPDNLDQHFASSVDEVRDNLTDDERDVLMVRYLDHEEQYNPDPTQQPEVWHREIEAALKKNSEAEAASLLINFGSRALVSYLLSMERQSSNSQTPSATSSSGREANSSDAKQQTQPTEKNR